tara:strand:+ start:125 stop:340 length:216 start_codon:yes stop_codon:yes gene_type:complete
MKGGERTMIDLVEIDFDQYEFDSTAYSEYANYLGKYSAFQAIINEAKQKQIKENEKLLEFFKTLKKKIKVA